MKKSNLAFALPCLMAMMFIAEKVFAGEQNGPEDLSKTDPHNHFSLSCEPSEQACYDWFVADFKIRTVKGLAIFRTKP